MRGIRKLKLAAAFWLGSRLAFAAVDELADIEQAERLEWSDPEAGLKVLDGLSAASLPSSSLVQMLEVRGMLCADVRRDDEVASIVTRLEALAANADGSAASSAHFLRAYLSTVQEQFSDARAQIDLLDIKSIPWAPERYRMLSLQGTILRHLGEFEGAMRAYEQALDVARGLHDDTRVLQAMLLVTRQLMSAGNSESAIRELRAARELALKLNDETALVDVERKESELAGERGDHGAERRASLSALAHAQHAGSDKWLTAALVNIAASYMDSGDFGMSLAYSKQALPLARKVHSKILEETALLNEGVACIQLGYMALGKQLAESAIAMGGDLFNQAELLQAYATNLEQAHDWREAIAVYHRYDNIRARLMTSQRQRALEEMSARFNDEREGHELELLRRDNALKDAEVKAQRARQQIILGAAVLIAMITLWAFTRVRKANRLLRYSSEHDALTGLANRRYFNERVLASESARPAGGCVILADLDHFKRINDTYGHPAGDAVLAVISKRLAGMLSSEDTLVRWGGEEFLAILAPMTDTQTEATVRRLLQAVRSEPVIWRERTIRCTVSIGYAIFPADNGASQVTLESAISLADKALYAAKQRGRDRACRVNPFNDVPAPLSDEASAEYDVDTAENPMLVFEQTRDTA